ncbi:MAG TPA: hypothetical protein VJ910_10835 [Desulfuromonadales bacterium]|nr:hypothetical protein [Desulfuromonadales bacterium]
MRKLALLCLLASALMLNACSSDNSDAPTGSNAHPEGWIATHSAEAEPIAPGYIDCAGCHGADLAGSGDAVSCFSCHAFNAAPPFTIHPANWSEAYVSHRGYAALNGFDFCTGCHGAGLRGSPAAPSCFANSVDGRGCHAEGPGQVPHPLDGSYLAGDQHGPEAKQDLTACQPCHGEAGGPGDNPRFNVGIESAGGNGCESCHGENYAHPQNWAGPNNTFHYSAASVQTACTLCHGVELDGMGGVGVSCLECHASATTFSLDCTSCHGYPPDGSPDVATSMGVDHSDVAEVGFHADCLFCHGVQESSAGGGFAISPRNYELFDKTTDTLGDHWDGNINMNSLPGYDPTNFGCDDCHGNDPEHRLSDSGLPVELEPYIF